MKKLNLKKNSKFLCVFFAVFTAAVLRQVGFLVNELLDPFLIILRASIYIGLFAIWGISVRNRIIQPQVRRYLTAVSTLMVFWITVRTIRYSLEECPWVMPMGNASSLVSVLSANTVYSASGGARRFVIGKAGELPTSEMGNAS